MTEVLYSPSSSSSPSISTPTHGAALFHQTQSYEDDEGICTLTGGDVEEEKGNSVTVREKRENDRRDQLSLLALLLTLFRKSFNFSRAAAAGRSGGRGDMEIGWPTDVEHVNHVTFDRFNGFLGLPVEFEPEVLRRAPSASTTVFGVSTESMQLSYDLRGNSIPTILLLMQRHLYLQRGLQAEGIFRITAGNSQEEFVRDQLNRGVVPEGIDVHCLAGLIKAWFRELPRGVLDSLSPEQVIQCQSEEECVSLVRLLPPTEAALLNWAINLMADVVQEEHLNKMNARNIAMVFAPNMTQMDDPLTALMYAVQVMNFLKTLIEKTLREREDSVIDQSAPSPWTKPSDDSGHQSYSNVHKEQPRVSNSGSESNLVDNISDEEYASYSTEESDERVSCQTPAHAYAVPSPRQGTKVTKSLQGQFEESREVQSSHFNEPKHQVKADCQHAVALASKVDDKNKGVSNLSRINSMTERFEAWR